MEWLPVAVQPTVDYNRSQDSSMKILPDRDNRRKWYVNDYHEFYFEGHTFKIRKGYRFDGHSTRPFHWFFKQDVNLEAAMLHDYILDTMPFHRFGKRFAARAYADIMGRTDTWKRRTFMPPVVTFFAWFSTCIRGDYRGKIKPNTVVDVRVII